MTLENAVIFRPYLRTNEETTGWTVVIRLPADESCLAWWSGRRRATTPSAAVGAPKSALKSLFAHIAVASEELARIEVAGSTHQA